MAETSRSRREQGLTDDDESLAPLEAGVPDPGFGVGATFEDLDDVSPPEIHEGELPVGFDLPVGEAGFVEPEQPPEPVDRQGDHVVEHHDPDADHDDDSGHLDLDL